MSTRVEDFAKKPQQKENGMMNLNKAQQKISKFYRDRIQKYPSQEVIFIMSVNIEQSA